MERNYDIEGLKERVDALAQKFEVSGIVGIYQNGMPLFRACYGHADRETAAPMGLDTRFCFDLRSRFVLALCALRLAEEKKLKLGDTLERFLPEYKHAARIQAKHLLQGMSGVPDYLTHKWRKALDGDEAHRALPEEERFLRERLMSSEKVSFSRLMDAIGEDDLGFTPGQKCDMSASESALLWELIERVSGMRLFDCLKHYVFGPLGMDGVTEGYAGDTAYYGRIGGKALVRMPQSEGAASVAYTVTLSDMEKLLAAFVKGELLSKFMWKSALRMNMYGVGLGFDDADGTYVASDVDFAAGNLRLYFSPENKVSYLVLLNEEQKMTHENGEFEAFCPKFRREVEAAFTFPKNPRVMPCARRYGQSAMSLEIAPEQCEFVPDAKSCLAICCIERPFFKPYVLLEGSRAIGFLGLRVDKKKDEYSVGLLLIDRRFQGRGYGKILLQFGVEQLKKQGAKELEIGVNRKNHVARRLYESIGFVAEEVYEGGVMLKMKL